jgi:hypothetical protein
MPASRKANRAHLGAAARQKGKWNAPALQADSPTSRPVERRARGEARQER